MTTARPLHAVTETTATTAAPEWEAPMPLGTSRAVPPFPIDAFPTWLADHVTAVANLTQTPPDLAGCLALVALSTAAGGRVRVQVRPGWDEPVNLYSVVVLPPASRKSAVFKAMTRPIRAVEKELVAEAKAEIESARIGRRAAEEFAARAEKAVLSADMSERDAALEAAVNAAMQVDKSAMPITPRLIADDATPEVVATLLADHGGRIAVLSAEGGLFGTLAGRYSGSPNLDVFLKGHAGDLHLVDRQGREATAVEEPAITLGLTIQPSILDGLARNETFREPGCSRGSCTPCPSTPWATASPAPLRRRRKSPTPTTSVSGRWCGNSPSGPIPPYSCSPRPPTTSWPTCKTRSNRACTP